MKISIRSDRMADLTGQRSRENRSRLTAEERTQKKELPRLIKQQYA